MIRIVLAVIVTASFLIQGTIKAQSSPDYGARQDAFRMKMDGGVALIYSAAQGGAPNKNFIYLTGETAPSKLLVLTTGSDNNTVILQEPGPDDEQSFSRQITMIKDYLSGAESVWALSQDTERVKSLMEACEIEKEVKRSDYLFYQLREIKDDYELDILQRAIDITAESYNYILKILEPGRTENEIINLFKQKQLEMGADGTSFIQAGSGVNGTQIHARASDKVIEKSDLVVFDVGAWYKGYTSDISRTFPATGKFTGPQKKIYQLVLDAQMAAIEKMVPGAVMRDVQTTAEQTLLAGLLRLGLITDINSQWQRSLYIVHGYYHYIGLDVHDVYSFMSPETATKTYEPGMVMTMEPGLYFPPDLLDNKPARARDLSDEEWESFVRATRKNYLKYTGIGVRIEDDVLITVIGNRILSPGVVREIRDIERIMK